MNMLNLSSKKLALTAMAFGCLGFASSHAALVVSTSTDSVSFDAYDGNISTIDLLATASISAGGIANTSGGVAVLTDGLLGGGFDGWANPALAETVTWDLGIGTGAGWDITEVNSISAFASDPLGGQEFILEYATVAAPTTFISLGSFGPLGGAGSGILASQVNITDDSGVIAGGVQFIRFEGRLTNQPNPAYRELDVFGTATVPEPSSYALLAGLLGLTSVMVRRRK